MALKLALIVLAGVLQAVAGRAALPPGPGLPGLPGLDADTAAVGSYVREVRAAAPQDYHKSYVNEGDGEIGYSRKKQGGGKKGYQHFDSFHKKAGDNYEFEKQDSFGHDDGGQHGAHGHHHEDGHHDGGHEGAYSHRHERREQAEKQQRYREPEREAEGESEGAGEGGSAHDHTHEELKEGASDGNGGVEAQGHDPKDYVLPQKYVYGEGDEYNF